MQLMSLLLYNLRSSHDMDTENVFYKKISPQFCLLKNNMIKNIHVHGMNYSYI
jgi:hypothetical protein